MYHHPNICLVHTHFRPLTLSARLPSSVTTNSQEKEDAFLVSFRDFCSQQSIHECEVYWTPFQIHMILQALAFCTFPIRMAPFAPFLLTCSITSLVLFLSSVPSQSSLIHVMAFIHRLLTQVPDFFGHSTTPPFSTKVNTMSPISFTVILSSPPINVPYMVQKLLLILEISKQAAFLSSPGKIFPSYRKVKIRKIKCFNTKRNGKLPLTSPVLVNSQL